MTTDPGKGRAKIYTGIPKTYNASFDYRIVTPLQTMEDLGLPVYPLVDMNEANIENDARIMAFSYSDYDVFYQPIAPSLLDNFKALHASKGGRRPDGTWKWIPTFIIDTDDDLFNVHPANPAFRHLGAKRPDGSPLLPGDELGMIDDQTEENVVMWRDGENGFSIAKNQQTLLVYREILKQAHAITCSTPEVEKYIKREIPEARTYIYPNSVRFDAYPEVELADHPQEIRVMWQGSPTHYEDIYQLADGMGEISKKYPQVRWLFWGAKYEWPTRHLNADVVKFLPWVPYAEYKPRLSMINHDINICPLVDHQFNRCRSAIKFYESSVISKPAATLAQATGAYKAEILEGQTGLLWNDNKEFVEKMSLLIEDAQLRKTLAANAKQWVSENRDAMKTVPKLWEFYQETRELQKAANPEPPEEGKYDAPELEFDHTMETNA